MGAPWPDGLRGAGGRCRGSGRRNRGRRLSGFFARYVEGVEDPPLDSLLREVGVRWHLRAAPAADRGGKPSSVPPPSCWIGARIGKDLSIQHVFSNSPAERSGLTARDVIVAVDHVRASPESVDALFTRPPGARITLHAFRRDELLAFDVALVAPPLDTCWLTVDDDAGSAVRRSAWLETA